MTIVRIEKDWDFPGIMRRTLGEKGFWDEIQFALDPVEECDYLFRLKRIDKVKKKDVNL